MSKMIVDMQFVNEKNQSLKESATYDRNILSKFVSSFEIGLQVCYWGQNKKQVGFP